MSEPLRILILEDLPTDAELMLRELQREGIEFEARRVETEVEFRRELRELRPGLILSDYRLPTWDGLSALEIVHREHPDLPFILVSGAVGEELAVESLHHGATDYILKERLSRLGPAVRRAVLETEEKDRLGRAELSLRDSELRYRRLFEAARDGVLILDAETGSVVDVNPFLIELLSLSRAEFLARKVWELGFFKDLVANEAHFEELKKHEYIRYEDKALETRDGRRIDVEFISNVYLVDNHKVIQCNIRDISDRKRAETARRESERRYRGLFESSRDAIMTLEPPDWTFTSANPATLALFGAQDESGFLVLGPSDLSPKRQPDGRLSVEKSREMIATAMRRGSHFFEWTHRRIGGGDFFADVLLTRMELGSRRILQVNVRDITERLRIAEESRVVLSTALDGFWIVDFAGRFLEVNAAYCRMIGYSNDELLTMKISDIEVDESPEKTAAHMAAIESTGTDRFLTHHRRKDGVVLDVEVSANTVPLHAGRIFVFVRDISERRRLESQFLQAQKMESVGRLAGGIAHDFNNLLTVILGTVDLALAERTTADPLCADLQEVRQAAEQAARLTRQLLAFSRRQILQPRILNLNEALAEMMHMLERLLGEDVAVAFVPGIDLDLVQVDPGQMEQVVANLAINARDAMPGGGRLTIETHNVTLDEAYAAGHPTVRPGPHVLLTVSDTGLGMDEATRLQIFEPFFTTKGPGSGTGLGLSTVYGIVKQSGGTIWVESEPGRGSCFSIYLPRAEGASPAPAAVLPAVTAPRGSETILVVEDETALRSLARRFLETVGYKVLDAANGEEALACLERLDAPVDLVITDVVMPGMGGRELARRLALCYSKLKIVFTSGYTDEAILHQGPFDDGSHFLAKPYTVAELRTKVREILDSPGEPPAAT